MILSHDVSTNELLMFIWMFKILAVRINRAANFRQYFQVKCMLFVFCLRYQVGCKVGCMNNMCDTKDKSAQTKAAEFKIFSWYMNFWPINSSHQRVLEWKLHWRQQNTMEFCAKPQGFSGIIFFLYFLGTMLISITSWFGNQLGIIKKCIVNWTRVSWAWSRRGRWCDGRQR